MCGRNLKSEIKNKKKEGFRRIVKKLCLGIKVA